jgi:hypothetical protein
MKESYKCEVATHIGPESCGAAREGGVEALTRERLALASLFVAAKPDRPRPLGSYAAPHHSLAAFAVCLSSLSLAPHGRCHLRQEPDAGEPPVRIRGGLRLESS